MVRAGELELREGFGRDDAAADLPAEIYASAERVSVGPSAPAELKLAVRVREGFHIVIDGEGLQPLRVGLIPGSGTGVTVYADYPDGERIGGGAPGPEARVLGGEFEIAVAVERNEQPWRGRPLLGVTYQACSDRACREAVTVELDVAVDEAAAG